MAWGLNRRWIARQLGTPEPWPLQTVRLFTNPQEAAVDVRTVEHVDRFALAALCARWTARLALLVDEHARCREDYTQERERLDTERFALLRCIEELEAEMAR